MIANIVIVGKAVFELKDYQERKDCPAFDVGDRSEKSIFAFSIQNGRSCMEKIHKEVARSNLLQTGFLNGIRYCFSSETSLTKKVLYFSAGFLAIYDLREQNFTFP